ncbi:hypothetical protein P7K49_032680 [Saguinus oedipus]|uniref:Peptidase S1 domain-containing protein n=1 Tax=Saguinus oedipus TaxID=9490 RepID=A0ABQ9TPR4_SAGOE|nr:hypothetical protein P7K49_032680 [Saguinus oedipus]
MAVDDRHRRSGLYVWVIHGGPGSSTLIPSVLRTAGLRLVLGLHALDGPGLAFHIKSIIQHPDYRPAPALENDLALLKVHRDGPGENSAPHCPRCRPIPLSPAPSCHSQLERKVRPSRIIQPLALPSKPQVVAAGARCSVAGWGLTQQGGHLAQVLQELDVHVLDTRMCNNSRFWNGSLFPNMVCLAAASKNQAPCKGDSGGPLVCGKRQVVAGVLSFSSRICTNTFKPPVATAVAPYMLWIRKVTG